MNTNHTRASDDILDRHIESLREMDIPQGPSPEAMSATLNLLRNAGELRGAVASGQLSIFRKLFHMTLMQRIAAVVMLTIGGTVIFFLLTLFNHTGASVAYADAIKVLQRAHTLSYTSTAMVGKTQVITKTMLKEPNCMRMEMPSGMTMIKAGRIAINISALTHTATKMELPDVPGMDGTSHGDLMEMTGLSVGTGVELPEKVIDGVAVKGWRVTLPQMVTTLWADKTTGMPIRAEMSASLSQGDYSSVLDHFVIDAPMENSLFSTEAPAGYTVTTDVIKLPAPSTQPAIEEKIEVAVSRTISAYAKANKGNLPVSLTDWGAFFAIEKNDPDHLTMPDIGGTSGRLFSLTNGYGYAGKGVKLGDKDKMVFWYKPAKSQTYRALFADLHIEDVKADRLPETEPTRQ